MCVGSVCTQPHYNDKNPPSVFFFYLLKSLPLSHIEPILDACLCDIAQTEAPPTIVDWQKSFSTDCTGVLPQTRPVWAVISCFNAGADVDKNDS